MGCCFNEANKNILIIGEYYSWALTNKYLPNEKIIIANNSEKELKEELELIPFDLRNKNLAYLPLDLKSNNSVFNFLKQINKINIDILINSSFYKGDYEITQDGIEVHIQYNNLNILLINLLLFQNINSDGRIITLIQNNYKSSNYSVEHIKQLQNDLNFNIMKENERYPYYGNSMLGSIFITKFLENMVKKNLSNIKVILIEKTSMDCNETVRDCVYNDVENGDFYKEKKKEEYVYFKNMISDKEIYNEYINYLFILFEKYYKEIAEVIKIYNN